MHILDRFFNGEFLPSFIGLALSLARRIVEEHHGHIEVTSTVGKGSKFTVLLPFHAPTPIDVS